MSPQAKAGAAGTLLAVLAWSAWYTLDADTPADPSASLATADSKVDIAPAAGPAPAPIDAFRPASAADTPPPAPAPQPAPSVLRDGFEMQHGVLTAMRSPVDPNAVPQARTAAAAQVALPDGARQEDVVVSVAGIVSVVRTNVPAPAAQAAPATDSTSVASRAVSLTRAP